jgi:energy-converting hydrogenase Eha subunit F
LTLDTLLHEQEKTMTKLRNIFRVWIPLAVVICAFSALGYATVQQEQRQGANDPQIQMAEDAAAALDNGATVDSIIPKAQVEMSTSLAPFIVLYNSDGKPTAASGVLNGQMPDYPKGSLDSATGSGENRVTWQPTGTVRIASVVVPFNGGFVMAGRNMREVEKRESQTELYAGLTGLLALIATFIVIALGEFLLPEKK